MPEFLLELHRAIESGLPWELRIVLVGVLVAWSCSLLSVYIVLRRMSMIAEGVAHSGFGGMGIALVAAFYAPFFDSPVVLQTVIGVYCLATALLIGFVTRAKRVHEDAAIGIFLVASMALGAVLVAVRKQLGSAGQIPSFEQMLFGEFSAVNTFDLYSAAGAAILVTGSVALFYHQLLYTTLDEDMARVNGVNTRFMNTLLLVLISLVIVVGVRMVGFLMITAITIIPAATANMISRRFGGVVALSLLIGVGGALVSLIAVFAPLLAGLPPGPLLVLTLFAIFVAVWVVRHVFKRKVVGG